MRIGIVTVLSALILSAGNGLAQEVREVGVAFLVDVSLSMGVRSGKKWQSVQKAINEGLAQVKEHAQANEMKVKVEAGVFLFDHRFYTSLDISNVDKKFPDHLEVNVDQFGGGTSLDTALL